MSVLRNKGIGARHSHLDNGGYGIDQKTLVNQKMKPEELVDTLLEEERWRQVLSSLVVCFFARGIDSPIFMRTRSHFRFVFSPELPDL